MFFSFKFKLIGICVISMVNIPFSSCKICLSTGREHQHIFQNAELFFQKMLSKDEEDELWLSTKFQLQWWLQRKAANKLITTLS